MNKEPDFSDLELESVDENESELDLGFSDSDLNAIRNLQRRMIKYGQNTGWDLCSNLSIDQLCSFIEWIVGEN